MRALGHLVVGIDAYRTSQGCPICLGQLADVPDHHYRVKHCGNCHVHFHRDSCSGQLMARLAKMHWNGQAIPNGLVRPPPSPPSVAERVLAEEYIPIEGQRADQETRFRDHKMRLELQKNPAFGLEDLLGTSMVNL